MINYKNINNVDSIILNPIAKYEFTPHIRAKSFENNPLYSFSL